MQKFLNPFPSVEYLDTFLEYNQMFMIGSSAQTCNSQTIVYFHDHNISLQSDKKKTAQLACRVFPGLLVMSTTFMQKANIPKKVRN